MDSATPNAGRSHRRSDEGRVEEVLHATEEMAAEAGGSRWAVATRIAFLVLALLTLYVLAPPLVNVWSELPRLRSVTWWWFPIMAALEGASLICLWWLIRIALPAVDWRLAGTAQLSGNAVSRFVPGGAAIGAALQFRMLAVGGAEPAAAATALGATGLLSTWVLFSVPLFAVFFSLLGAPISPGMSSVAWGGTVVFLIMLAAGVAVATSDRLIEIIGRPIEQATVWLAQRRRATSSITVAGLLEQRNEMVSTLGSNYRQALLAIVGNWLLDYLVLMSALLAIGTEPRFSAVLLAYAGAAVLTMIPITPGGLGFVEAGLTAMLTLSGVPSQDALLATLLYRLVNYWLPLPAGVGAYLLFRRHYGRPPDLDPQGPSSTGSSPPTPAAA